MCGFVWNLGELMKYFYFFLILTFPSMSSFLSLTLAKLQKNFSVSLLKERPENCGLVQRPSVFHVSNFLILSLSLCLSQPHTHTYLRATSSCKVGAQYFSILLSDWCLNPDEWIWDSSLKPVSSTVKMEDRSHNYLTRTKWDNTHRTFSVRLGTE